MEKYVACVWCRPRTYVCSKGGNKKGPDNLTGWSGNKSGSMGKLSFKFQRSSKETQSVSRGKMAKKEASTSWGKLVCSKFTKTI